MTVTAERDRVLRERQNARYDAVVDSAPDVILTLDAEDTIQLANPATVRLFGYTSQELIGRPAAILFKGHAAWNKIRRAVLSGDAVPQPVELIAVRKDSSPSYLEGSLSRWASDSRVFITAILRDVNERRAAEATLRASEEQFRSMAQAVPNHVWTASPDGMLDWFNDRVYEYSGTKPGMLDGQGWGTIVYPDDLAAVTERWAAAVASGDPYCDLFFLDKLPPIGLQPVIELAYQLYRFVAVRSHGRVNHLGEELEENIARAVNEVEPAIRKNPVVWPIKWVVHAMLPYIARGVFKTSIVGAHRGEIEQPP